MILDLLLSGAIFLVGAIYSSVGHGGASGYIAVMTLFGLPAKQVATTALILNLVAAGTASYFFWRAKHFNFSLIWPFLITSIPAAFLGGAVKLPIETYEILLFATLAFASYRLLTQVHIKPHEVITQRIWIKLLIGAVIGFLSGAIGVGGGIFLSPILLFLGWADAKKTACASAIFIFLNSLSGLFGKASGGNFFVNELTVYLVIAVVVGSQIGSRIGAFRFSNLTLRRILGIVLVLASIKLFQTILF